MDGRKCTCEMCDACVYIGEGDYVCIIKDEPELVIEDWEVIRTPCNKVTKVKEVDAWPIASSKHR